MPYRKRSRDQAESQHSDPKKIHAGTDLSADSTAVAAAAVIDPDGEEQKGEEHQKRHKLYYRSSALSNLQNTVLFLRHTTKTVTPAGST